MKKHLQILTLMALIKSFLLISNASAQSCPSDLISYWRMDESSGYVLSETKNSYTATRNSNTGPISGKIDNSQRFTFTVNITNDGYTYFEYASVPDNSAFDFAGNSSFTISYWCRFSDYEYGIQDHIIISKGDWEGGGAGPEGMFGSGCNGAGKINFLLRDNLGNGVDQDVETASGYGDGDWHHVACVRDASSSKNILYIDGVNRGERVVTYSGNFGSANDLLFGALIDNGNRGFYYKGDVDEVAFFSKALNSAEIATIISNANTGTGICSFSNEPPDITSTPNTVAMLNQAYSYDVQATGAIPITYSLVTAPAGMTINATSGLISWTPSDITANGHVIVRATNSIGTDEQDYRINIGQGAACPSDQLVLLKLNESSGPVYADYYGTHNATASVAPTATTGKIDGAQQFNTSTKLDIPDLGTEFDWASTASFSFSCWIKTSTTAGMVAVGRNRIDYSTAASWWIGTNTSGYAAFELRDNGSHNCVLGGSKLLNDGQWHFIVGIRDNATSTNKLYVDGVLEASQSMTYANSFLADNPTEINVGYFHRADPLSEPEYHFIGSIDEVAIFNRAVSGSEVSSFYNSGSPAGYCSIDNYAPVITSTPVTSVNEDVAYSYTFTVNDLDATDVLTLSAITKPSWLSFNWTTGQKTATLTGTPNSSQVGDHNVTLRVSDGQVNIDQSFVINVVNVNTEPQVTSTPVTSVNEDQAYSYTITVTDNDIADVISMAADTKPSWLTFSYTAGAKTATLTGTPSASEVGTGDVDISITDGHHTIHHTFNITVNAVNDAPVITAQSDITTNEDVAITLQKANFTITDEDNNLSDITIQVQSGTNYTFVGNTITPAANYNGTLTVNVVARDLSINSEVFHALVTVTAVNDAPVITSTPPISGYVGNLYAYILTASDVDDVTLTKSVVQKPDWLQFSPANGVLTGTPAQADKGQHLVILRVSDGKIDTDEDFVITVDGPNGIESLEDAGIHVFPVPAKNNLEIRLENAMETTCVDIISSVGSVVKKAVISANQQSFSLDLEGIETGIYYLRLSNDNMQRIGRIMIIK